MWDPVGQVGMAPCRSSGCGADPCVCLQECTDPCCNASWCVLNDGADCSRGECCSDQCRFYPLGRECRAAAQQCDLTEFCTGDSSDCPRDVHFQDGTPCNSGSDYCYSGFCEILDDQCQVRFGKP